MAVAVKIGLHHASIASWEMFGDPCARIRVTLFQGYHMKARELLQHARYVTVGFGRAYF